MSYEDELELERLMTKAFGPDYTVLTAEEQHMLTGDDEAAVEAGRIKMLNDLRKFYHGWY